MRIKMKNFHDYINESRGKNIQMMREDIKEYLADFTTYYFGVKAAKDRVTGMDEEELRKHGLTVKDKEHMLKLLKKADTADSTTMEKVVAGIDKLPDDFILSRYPSFIRDSQNFREFPKICGVFLINVLNTLKGKL